MRLLSLPKRGVALRQAQGYSRDTKISRVSSAQMSSTADVIVIGGGLIGTSISWRLRQAGVDVVMVVGERSSAASGVAAGMLAPITETTFTEQRLLQLNIASLSRYPDFAAELEQASGLPTGLRRTPSLSVAYDADDAARLATFADFLARVGHPWRAADQPRVPAPRAIAGTVDSLRPTGRGRLELRQPIAVAGSDRGRSPDRRSRTCLASSITSPPRTAE